MKKVTQSGNERLYKGFEFTQFDSATLIVCHYLISYVASIPTIPPLIPS